MITIGRKKEIARIKTLLTSPRSEFLALTGRRRVGKTFLIDNVLGDHYCFSMTGIQNGNTQTQLVNFAVKLAEYAGNAVPIVPENWQLAFLQLKNYLKTLDKNRKQVLFIDELPWVSTARSGFVQMLAHFWNDYLSKESHFILVICGSASSWISRKIINDPGGLHNRVTENIHLYPFTLSETREFLRSKGLQFSLQDIAKIYMTLGGVPFYLEQLHKGESFSAAIERICFSPNGILHNEYNNLFNALFTNAEVHQSIVGVLATQNSGLTHTEILQHLKMPQATGSYQRAIEELIISDFIIELSPYGKKKRGAVYQLIDEYCVFYHQFISQNKRYSPGLWQQLAEGQSYKVWAGYAFEMLCHKHIDAIKQALGIAAIYTQIYSMRIPSAPDSEGFQIGLLIDRKDDSINLCEMKFYNGPFTVNKTYYQELLLKKQRFMEYSGTKKQVFITLITNHGVVDNEYAKEIVDVQLSLVEMLV